MSKETNNDQPVLIYISPRNRETFRVKRLIESLTQPGDIIVTYQDDDGEYRQIRVTEERLAPKSPK